jgi:hypothetical protein
MDGIRNILDKSVVNGLHNLVVAAQDRYYCPPNEFRDCVIKSGK